MSTPILIQSRKPVPNRWRIREAEPSPGLPGEPTALAAGDLVPLALWKTVRERLAGPSHDLAARVGVLLSPEDDPYELRTDLHRLGAIAIRFPVFTDGRGYSAARLLRQQLGYRGPLMAVGDVLRDQLLLLERCGFDTFWLREDQNVIDALAAFDDFSDAYQAAAARVPLFARRQPRGETRP